MIRASKHARQGASVVQVALVLALIAVGVLVSVQFLGTTTNDDLNQTAGEVGDPGSLVGRFGSGSASDGGSEDSGGESDDWFR